MGMHIAPFIREMDNARITAGLLINLNSTGYTERVAQEQAGTVPTPVAPFGFFYFAGQKLTPTL